MATDYAVVGLIRRTFLVLVGSAWRLGRWLIDRKPAADVVQRVFAEEEYEEEAEYECPDELEEALVEAEAFLTRAKKQRAESR